MIAELTGTVRFFEDELSSKAWKKLKKDLTVKYFKAGQDDPDVIHAFYEADEFIDVPRQFGIAYAHQHGIRVEDFTSLGSPLPEEGFDPVTLFDYQEPFVADLLQVVQDKGDLIAEAATGKGKTVMSIEAIRRLGRTAVVIVDQDFLKNQWIKTAQKFFGVPEDKIGTIQGSTCDVEGKWIVIAMIQTLYSRDLDESVYESFGTMVVDEAHTAGAPQFSKALTLFPAKYRWGVTATPDRRDALQKILHWSLGGVDVQLKDEHKDSEVRYIEYPEAISWFANSSPKGGRYINELATDPVRNTVLAQSIKWLYDSGRDTLAVSDRIWQLENVMALCAMMGIPEEDMGLVAGYEHSWGYAKDPTPPRRPRGWEKETEYTPVSLQLVKRRIKREVLEDRKTHKRIVFATYGMFNKGVDAPRIAAGIDLTPRSKVVQVHGRILRKQKGKLVPVWVTIRDFNCYKAEYQFMQRIGEYQKSNGEVYLWRPGKGKKLKDVRELKKQVKRRYVELKDARILTGKDGRNTVMILDTESRLSRDPAKRTGRRTRSMAVR